LDRGGAVTGAFGTGEQRVFLADGDETDHVLDRVVVDRQVARAGVALQRGPTLEGVLDGLGRSAAGSDGA
jgi:hypothetical protein